MTAMWSCPKCRLSSTPDSTGPIALLAKVHDDVHHGGALTATVIPAQRTA